MLIVVFYIVICSAFIFRHRSPLNYQTVINLSFHLFLFLYNTEIVQRLEFDEDIFLGLPVVIMISDFSKTSLFMLASSAFAFNLYPTIDSDSLAKRFDISIDCLDALNETVTCDQTLFQMANTVDSYLWTTANLTDLCTADCIQSSQKWWSDVQDRCAMDTIAAYGKLIPAESVAGRFSDGLGIACLKSASDIPAPGLARDGSSSSTGSAPYSTSSASSTGPVLAPGPYSNSSSTLKSNSSASSWCLIESQDWVGSDIIRPDCSPESTDPSCSDPDNVAPQNERIANLYDDDLVRIDGYPSFQLEILTLT